MSADFERCGCAVRLLEVVSRCGLNPMEVPMPPFCLVGKGKSHHPKQNPPSENGGNDFQGFSVFILIHSVYKIYICMYIFSQIQLNLSRFDGNLHILLQEKQELHLPNYI